MKKMTDHEEYYFEIESKEIDSIKQLEEHIEYKSPRKINPKLPKKPDGFLYGVGFIFDEDFDLRVLVAINKLNEYFIDWALMGGPLSKEDLIAVSEHEGVLKIYSRHPVYLKELPVCGDIWQIESHVPYMEKWIKIDEDFMISCVHHVLSARKYFKIDE